MSAAHVLVPVYLRGQINTYALIDAADAEAISRYRWLQAGIHAGAGARLDREAPCLNGFLMHRLVLGLTRGDGKLVHHVNEDALDNRRENLEVCDSAAEANSRPHPRRDSWHLDLPRHYRETLIEDQELAA